MRGGHRRRSWTMRPAVFLDRDGVLTAPIVRAGRPYAPTSLEEFIVLADASSALYGLKQAGFVLIVVTNQPDVTRGLMSRETVDEMHELLRQALPIDDIFVCYCLEEDANCSCYKPRPGMLLEAARKWGIELARSFIVGDRWRDVGAGHAAGCTTVFVDHGYASDRPPARPAAVVHSLQEACHFILQQRLDR